MKKRLFTMVFVAVLILGLLATTASATGRSDEAAAVNLMEPTVVYTSTNKPFSRAYVSDIVVNGVEVKSFTLTEVSGTTSETVYDLDVLLTSDTAADATANVTVTAGGTFGESMTMSPGSSFAVQLANGTGNQTLTANYSLYTTTWNIHFTTARANTAPTLTGDASAIEQCVANTEYTLDISALFTDTDGDTLTYQVSTDDGDWIGTDAEYSCVLSDTGTHILKFRAWDGLDYSDEYTVTLTVTNADTTHDVTVNIPVQAASVRFYATTGVKANGYDVIGDQLDAVPGTAVDGFVPYTVKVPENISRISIVCDGARISTKVSAETQTVTVQKTDFTVKTAAGVIDTDASLVISNGNYRATGSGTTFYLVSGSGYTFAAKPGSQYADTWNTATLTDQSVTEESTAEIEIVLMVKDPKTVTVPNGAEVHVYYQDGYSDGGGNNTEISPAYSTVDSEADTVTWFYSCSKETGYGYGYSYTAFYRDYISYAGYLKSVTDVVLSWDNETRKPEYRGSYDKSTTMGSRGDDSVLTNVNSNSHLVLSQGAEFLLKAYRSWQIIDSDTTNVIIEPEFCYDASNSNLAIVPYNDRTDSADTASGTSSNNWVYITAENSGVTYLEVSYDALHIVNGYHEGEWGGSSAQPGNFTWNACDPSRTTLIVVQTDGKAASGINFGIQSPSGAWDYEYDTVYFTEEQGTLTMMPTISDGNVIASVAVSHDRGASYTNLSGNDGTYTVPIVSGNNIIRITDGSGKTAYQVVRGDRITTTVTNITEGKEANDAVEPGDTVHVAFDGVHTPCAKISGIYNPGYPTGNLVNYTFHEETVSQSTGYQYNFLSNAWIEVTIPEDTAVDHVLTNGCMIAPPAFGSAIGALYDAEKVNSSGSGTECRGMLPEVVLFEAENDAPVSNTELIEISMKLNEWYSLDLDEYFEDPNGDELRYSVTFDDQTWIELENNEFRYYPAGDGMQMATFMAEDPDGAAAIMILVADVAAITDEVTVNVSVTTGKDAFYYAKAADNILVPQSITVPYFDLALYGLQNYYYNPQCYMPADGTPNSGAPGTAETAEGVVTAMHVFIWMTEVYYLGYDEAEAGMGLSYKNGTFADAIFWTGGAGFTYVSMWGTTNMSYYLNGAYPLGAPGWGSSSDQQALYDGDIIRIHMIEDKNAIGSGFSALTANDADDQYDIAEDDFLLIAKQGETVTLNAYRSQAGETYNDTNYIAYTGANVVMTTELSSDLSKWTPVGTTDENGQLVIDTSSMDTGIYYLAVCGTIIGNSLESVEIAPALFVLVLEEQEAVLPGDMDGNGEIDTMDVTNLYNALRNDEAVDLAVADMNGDGEFDVLDVTAIYNQVRFS